MNDILNLFLSGDYAQGIAHFDALAHPSAEDCRWAGACALNLDQTPRAKELFLQVKEAYPGAGVGLATAYRITNEYALAQKALSQVPLNVLSPLDLALYWREVGALRFVEGHLPEATEALEQAWAAIFSAPEGERLKGTVAQTLAFMYGVRGLDRQAEGFLEDALTASPPARRVYVLAARALRRIYLGRMTDAQADLDEALPQVDHLPAARAIVHYTAGLVAWAMGQLDAAVVSQEQAVQFAQGSGDRETEAYAHLALASVYIAMGNLSKARQCLARLRILGVNPHVEHLRDLRAAALTLRTGSDPLPLAQELERVATTFEANGRTREAGWAWLHTAEAWFMLAQQDAAEQALCRAVDARHTMQSGAPLVPELRALPHVTQYLDALPPEHYSSALRDDLRQAQVLPMHVHVQTLGTAEILLDGRPVGLDYHRGVEILVFLLRHPHQKTEDIITALFEEDPKRSRNYFHQVRYDLERKVPGLSIPASPKRTYSVKCIGGRLTWDVQELELVLAEHTESGMFRALDLYAGPFLPKADGEWARGEREDMAWKLIKVGLELMEDWYDTHQYDKCVTLAGRLLEVDPFDEAVYAFMIRAVHQLGDHPARRHALARLSRKFEAEMGELPPALLALQRGTPHLN